MQENRWQNKGDTFTHPWMLTNFKGHTGQVLNMDFSSNNKYLASNAEGMCIIKGFLIILGLLGK